ncbi:hypothetical protein SLEP1_g32971 [Rubroshorea leprosula]|uniref:Uncharacterized protein n=1 Tax=Rubroshorea leprosula TaxID=152421 RepID=A0AAV5KF81_9ROSI|nr:hypothetical protein SLEP1_g32971 [Rubroshorea leprosula]
MGSHLGSLRTQCLDEEGKARQGSRWVVAGAGFDAGFNFEPSSR